MKRPPPPLLLLVEARTEELPPPLLAGLAEQFSANLLAELRAAGFAGDDSRPAADAGGRAPCLATPRRIAALLEGVRTQTPPRETIRKGPQTAAGLDAGGKPTAALAGFLRANRAAAKDLTRVADRAGREFFALRITEPGRALDDHLGALIERALAAVVAPRLMRWGSGAFRFVRPLRGIAALCGRRALAARAFGVDARPQTRGRRAGGDPIVKLGDAARYQADLARAGIIADFNARLAAIDEQLRGALQDGEKLAADAGALAREAAAMSESPFVFRGEIRDRTLIRTLPPFCITTCMQKHQRYFPVHSARGRLSPFFLFVADNAPARPARMIRGFEQVLAARLKDAAFFYREDQKTGAAENLQKLQAVVYHRKLGSQAARARRIEAIAAGIAGLLKIDAAAQATLQTAARICKADLPTRMIGEYPELEGLMAARYFAETPAVARAVAAHLAPGAAALRANDALFCLCAAAALEKLCGLFYAGEAPSGGKDPHGLRRAGGLVLDALSHNQRANRMRLSLRRMITRAGDCFVPAKDALAPQDEAATFADARKARINEDIFGFLLERLRRRHLADYSPQIVAAALAVAPESPPLLAAKLAALKQFRRAACAPVLANLNKRINNILRKSATGESPPPVNAAVFQCEEERALYRTICRLEKESAALVGAEQFAAALALLAQASAPIDAFFDKVLVLCDDPKRRANRLALLARLRDLLRQVADISQLAI